MTETAHARQGWFELGPRSADGFGSCGVDVRLEHDTTSRYLSNPHPTFTCKLPRGHIGDHDANANWRGHFKAEPTWGGALSVEIRHDHGYGVAQFRSREQVEGLCAWLMAQAEQVWPNPNDPSGFEHDDGSGLNGEQ